MKKLVLFSSLALAFAATATAGKGHSSRDVAHLVEALEDATESLHHHVSQRSCSCSARHKHELRRFADLNRKARRLGHKLDNPGRRGANLESAFRDLNRSFARSADLLDEIHAGKTTRRKFLRVEKLMAKLRQASFRSTHYRRASHRQSPVYVHDHVESTRGQGYRNRTAACVD